MKYRRQKLMIIFFEILMIVLCLAAHCLDVPFLFFFGGAASVFSSNYAAEIAEDKFGSKSNNS